MKDAQTISRELDLTRKQIRCNKKKFPEDERLIDLLMKRKIVKRSWQQEAAGRFSSFVVQSNDYCNECWCCTHGINIFKATKNVMK